MFDFTERTEKLINTGILANKRVAVFGIGGVGSYTAEALVRAGIGSLLIVDSDNISVSNINRQLIALHSTIGRKKIDVAAERYLDINPDLKLFAYNSFILPENIDDFFSSLPVKPDYVADCIDTVSGKLALVEKCSELVIPIISCMGTGNKLDSSRFKITDINKTSVCPLCKVMRHELKERGINKLDVLWSDESPIQKTPPIGSVSYVPSVAGLLIAGYIVKQLMD